MVNLIILGAGGHAKEVYSTIEYINAARSTRKYNITGFYDDVSDKTSLYNLKVYKNTCEIEGDNIMAVLGVGVPRSKSILINKFVAKGYSFETIIHPVAIISPHAKIGEGAVIQSFSVICPDIRIGDYFSCNDHVQIGHDAVIGDNVHINSNVNISGGASIGDHTFIGVKASILRVDIGRDCIIGACTLVNKDIPDESKAIGIPVKYFPSDGNITFGTR